MPLSKILLVEDDPDIQKVAEKSLKFRGVPEVVTVSNGEECLAVAAQLQPDVILLDVMMPKMDGYETCRRLQLDPATRRIPVIFLTAKAQQFEVRRGYEVGAVGYLTKPFDPMLLHDQIVALLEEPQRGPELAS
jgi:CheY-like chemotaxis protein